MKLSWGRWQFAPHLWPTVATAVFVALTLSLGNWQVQRATYKRTLQARADAAERDSVLHIGSEKLNKEDLLYRQVEVKGVFDPAHEILLDNRIYNGIAGYHVLTPLKIEGGNRYVLVNRGWVPVGKDRRALPRIPRLAFSVKIHGLALDPNTRYFELPGAQPAGNLWQNLNFERYVALSGLNLQPLLLQQSNDTGDGLIRDWPRPDTGIATHVSYAIQWYGLAATLVVLWLTLNLKRDVSTDGPTH
jgi:surfeit locus 1 family protein